MNKNRYFVNIICAIFLCCTIGCTDISGLEKDVQNLTERVDNLENAVKSLQLAMDAGKLVKSVDSDEEGWTVTFSDNTSLYIVSREGLKTAVPRISVDDVGYWIVSYDGDNYGYLLDNSGDKIQAIGKDGITPETISVRVIIDDEGYYAFELYSTLTPETVFDVITLPYTANPSTVISSIVKNDVQDLITISMADGTIFDFKIAPSLSANHECDISSVRLLLKDNREYLLKDVMASIQGDNINILIPYICNVSDMVVTVALVNKDAKVVENIEDGLDLTKGQEITVTHPNGASKKYTINTKVFTGLPIMTIETENRFISSDKTIYVKGAIDISKTNEFPSGFTASTQFRGRGNATWNYPKKPYRIKLDRKASLFDIPPDKSWVLLASYCDRTLLRASVHFKFSELLQLDWTPKWQYIELFLNGQYEGNYLFTEHIKTSAGRVKIEDDGYLFEKDTYATREPVYFVSGMGYYFSFKTPDPDDGITQTQIDYASSYISKLETALNADDILSSDASFLKIIDIESWVKWYLVNFLMANQDTNDYYVITTAGARLKKGPVWDAEWSVGIGWDNLRPIQYNVDVTGAYAYYPIMMKNPYFKSEVYRIFMENKESIKSGVIDYINEMYDYLYLSQQYNFEKWPVMNSVISVNYTSNGTWENEIQYLKSYLLKRIEWTEYFLSNY